MFQLGRHLGSQFCMINSWRPVDVCGVCVCVHQQTGSALPEPMLIYQLDSQTQTSVKFESHYNNLNSRKFLWKYGLHEGQTASRELVLSFCARIAVNNAEDGSGKLHLLVTTFKWNKTSKSSSPPSCHLGSQFCITRGDLVAYMYANWVSITWTNDDLSIRLSDTNLC